MHRRLEHPKPNVVAKSGAMLSLFRNDAGLYYWLMRSGDDGWWLRNGHDLDEWNRGAYTMRRIIPEDLPRIHFYTRLCEVLF